MTMKLIDNWTRHVWRLWSTRLSALAAFIAGTWPLVPADLKDRLPPQAVNGMALAAFIAILVSRLISQDKPNG